MTTTASYGSWESPITAASIVAGAATITEVVVDGDDIWWLEIRPSEGGRGVVLRRDPDGNVVEVTPPAANVRTRVHEYGGGAWWVHDGTLIYCDLADQQLRRLDRGGALRVLTADVRSRYADGRVTADGAWYVCVRERHPQGAASAADVQNEIVAVALDGSARVEVLVSGPDFVACPRPGPDGRTLVWLQWDHPDMPWDGTALWSAEITANPSGVGAPVLVAPRRLAGGRDESLTDLQWAPTGALHVVSDRTGWWNLYRVDLATGALTGVQTGEFEIGGPMWVFGQSSYACTADGRVVTDHDIAHVMSDPTCIRACGDAVVVAGATWSRETHVVQIDADGSVTTVRAARDLGLDPAYVPPPEPITFPTGDAGAVAHAWFYAPANPRHAGPSDARPPLVVMAHGGPTGAARRSLHLPIRYWTSRGFAVVDVDYRGSTGYGRTYRHALDGGWGIADVEDVVAAAQFLAARGDVDPERLLVRGGSAGGYTVLCALTFHDVFAAGASLYGIADLEALARDTHKFEARYLDRLVAPYPAQRDVYVARSPIHHTDLLSAPMIILQGADDRVVPANQAEMMASALRDKGVPYAYLLFPGEGHGFRRAENIVRALEAELSFYAQLFGFTPADAIDPVPIRNLR